jgi:cell division protein FtsQ
MKKLFQILKWGMLLAVMVVVLAFTNKKQEQQLIELDQINIEASEDEFVTKALTLEYIRKHNFDFDRVILFRFYLHDLEAKLLNHPVLKKVEVYSNQEGMLSINLQQRKALVRIKTSSTDYYLDEDGLEMPLSKNYTPRVLVVSGDVNPSHHSDIFSFIKTINKNEFWESQITQLHFEADEVIVIPRVGNQKIHFGILTNIHKKLDNLYQFYKQVMPVKGWQTYSDISVKYNNQIVCTKK